MLKDFIEEQMKEESFFKGEKLNMTLKDEVIIENTTGDKEDDKSKRWSRNNRERKW